ncbi:MAG: hypothetical protein ACRBHB_19480 [Arenicella sp.]
MSNHYHVVLHVRKDIAHGWTDKEVVERWHALFSGSFLSHKLLSNAPSFSDIHSPRSSLWPSILAPKAR